MFLRCFIYKVYHIEGESNVWADMLSRWGAAAAGATTDAASSSSIRDRSESVD